MVGPSLKEVVLPLVNHFMSQCLIKRSLRKGGVDAEELKQRG